MSAYTFSALLVPLLLGAALFLFVVSSDDERSGEVWSRHLACDATPDDCLPQVIGQGAVVTERTTHRFGRRSYTRSRTYVRVTSEPGQAPGVPTELDLTFSITARMNMDLTGPVTVVTLDGRPLGLVDASGDLWATVPITRRWILAERQAAVWLLGGALVSGLWVAPLSRRCLDERWRRRHRLFEPPTMWYGLIGVAVLPLWLSDVSNVVAWSIFGLLFVPAGWTFVLACRWLRHDEPLPVAPVEPEANQEPISTEVP